MKNVYCIPGHRWQLSFAELLSFLETYDVPNRIITANNSFFIFEIEEEKIKLLAQLGGILEYGIIEKEIEDKDILETEFEKYLKETLPQIESPKKVISVKAYSRDTRYWNSQTKLLGKLAKEIGKQMNFKVRYLTGDIRSTAQFTYKIKDKGIQYTIIEYKKKLLLGKTIDVQDSGGFIIRDREKPFYSPDVGMLPPKLARIMTNLVKGSETQLIWDPFCGSGTVLMEALMLGYNLIGTDISVRSIKNSQGNIEWLINKLEIDPEKPYMLFERRGVAGLHQTYASIPYNQRGTISFVGEPYLGPPIRKNLPPKKLYSIKKNVENIINDFIDKVEYIEKKNRGIVQSLVLVIPIYKARNEWIPINITKEIRKLNKVGLVPPTWMKEIKKYSRDDIDLTWFRERSYIKRKILILHKDENFRSR